MTTVLEEFRLQSRFCADFGSPFTSELPARGTDQIEAGGWRGSASSRRSAVTLAEVDPLGRHLTWLR